jgi:hypothetical protein
MVKAKRIKDVEKRVRAILIEDRQARNSDSFLYLKVLQKMGAEKGIDIEGLSIPTFLLTMSELGFPPFESVRRARQKLQEHNPELRACEAVEEARAENELGYREYVKSAV